MICPLYKAAMIAAGNNPYIVSYTAGHTEKREVKPIALCDRDYCEAWNVMTGTCGLNNYSLTKKE